LEHNLQSLRIVDRLEHRYLAFDGLNLCFETREGILKHCKPDHARRLGELGQRFIARTQPSIEAQIANLADEIAYNNHDIDDGIRSGLLAVDQLRELSLFNEHYEQVKRRAPDASGRRLVAEIIRAMINTLVTDLTTHTLGNLRQHQPDSVEAVRQLPPIVAFSPEIRRQATAMKQFLLENLSRHFLVLRMTTKARALVMEPFIAFMQEPRLLDQDYQREDPAEQARAIADYIAGMTDRYAIAEHNHLFRM